MARGKRENLELPDDPLWYKDAIIYELHVRGFCDSDGDGIGDFRGLIEKLDYLQDLGITAIWVLPFCPSPLRDDGYDIADFTGIHPAYSSLRDFKAFLREAHRRGLRVITELVFNQGDAWQYTQDVLAHFLEHILARRDELEDASAPQKHMLGVTQEDFSPFVAFNRTGGQADLNAEIKDLRAKMEKMKRETTERVSKVREETAEALEDISKAIRKEKPEPEEPSGLEE